MDSSTSPVDALKTAPQRGTTKKHIRGSSLMLVGRLCAMVFGLAVQVLIVNYLAKSDYGAFAYALSIVSLGSSVAVFGLDKALPRFLSIYHEHHAYDKLFGTIVMMASTILSLGLGIVLLVYGLHGLIGRSVMSDQQANMLLFIMILLAPVQAIGSMIGGMFAVFAKPREIFFRRYLLEPGLQLSAVILVIVLQYDVYLLASGYLISSMLATIISLVILFRVLRNQGLFQHFNRKTMEMPVREIFGFTIPLLPSDLVFILRSSLVIILLGYFGTTADVAAFRAVLPVAALNMVVLQSFKILFTPLASRMFAQDDREGINDLYWQSAIWIAVLSFPIFIVSFSLAWPLTVLLFGARYQDSAIILSILALGYYFNAALGFNGLALRVFGKVRYILMVDFLAVVTSVGFNLFLIPRYGALGAAIGTCGAMVFQNICYQVGLRLNTGVSLFDRRYVGVYLSITLGALGVFLVQSITTFPAYLSFALAILVAIIVVRINRTLLNVEETFPELLRVPLVRRFFADNGSGV